MCITPNTGARGLHFDEISLGEHGVGLTLQGREVTDAVVDADAGREGDT